MDRRRPHRLGQPLHDASARRVRRPGASAHAPADHARGTPAVIAPRPRDVAPGPSAPKAARRLADIVHEQLDRLIARGEFPKGCKLPPEGELATRFGVSRPVIRDALSRLKDQGYVRSQRGSGTIVVRGEAPGKHAYP